jgi:hypothetical protein
MSREAKKTTSTWWVAPLLLLIGFGGTAANWYGLYADQRYYPGAALITPFVGFLGLAMLIAPDVGTVTTMAKLRRFLARALIGIGLLASIADFVLINGWI